jgi:hypothetical protein
MTDVLTAPGEAGAGARARALRDEAEIADLICSYAAGIDMRDWTLFRSCFTDEIETDFRTIGDMDLFRGPADDWVKVVRGFIEGLDSSQHLMGNIAVEVDGDQAVARSYVQAQHMLATDLGEPQYILAGHYRHELVRTPQGWRSRKYGLTIQWTSGNRYLLQLASERSKSRGR